MSLRESHPATVTNNKDPLKRGRIKVACAALLGDESQELPMWIPMLPAWGWFSIPDVGEVVEIEAHVSSDDDEQFGQTSIDNMDLKYRTHRYYGNSETDTPRPVPDDFTARNYGKRRGFATPKGHVLLFDDTDGDERLSLCWTNGTKAKEQLYAYVGMDKDGSLLAGNSRGTLLSLDAKNRQALLIDEFSNAITLDENGIHAIDKFGQSIDMAEGKIQVAAPAVTVNCKNALIDAGQIDLAAHNEKAVLGDTWLKLFAGHIHPTGMGPSGPPIPGGSGDASPWMAALSQVVKLS